MLMIENKLELFEDVVYKSRLLDFDKRKTRIQEETEKIVKEKEEALREEKETMMERRHKLATVLGNEKISKAKEQRRVLELQKMDQLEEDFVEAIMERAKKFTLEDRYREILLKGIDVTFSHLTPGTYRMGLTQKDMDVFFEEIEEKGKKLGISLIPNVMGEEIIGGHVVSDEANTYNLNNDLRTMVEEKRYEIGKLLYKLFHREDQNGK
ncbi:hypothetical protein LQU94_06650 [Peptoniphilus sp. KCTC 25270]|uniref:hypothetical protein n=1 Tax=Peptoniphilus sp. KCTC 25270 TaxID=2897414 RepID=UPI001E5513AA|nr:hypothetical protein [Peptoniphilus sp. KCTC 25270]MCD1147791.1 hypothetical protein [Peptoniphilus sp. KCTC 25270]